MDLFTTLLSLSGLEIPQDRPIDGLDLSGALLKGETFDRPVFFYRGDLLFAVRFGPYKMHLWTWTTPQSELDQVRFGLG
jgi:arylsulfatase A